MEHLNDIAQCKQLKKLTCEPNQLGTYFNFFVIVQQIIILVY